MEALLLALVVVAFVVIVLRMLRRPSGRTGPSGASSNDGRPTVIVAVDLPVAQRASFVDAIARQLDDPIRIRSGAHRSMLPPPSTPDHVLIDARDGDRAVDVVLSELYRREFLIESAAGHSIGLSDRAGAEAIVTVHLPDLDAT